MTLLELSLGLTGVGLSLDFKKIGGLFLTWD